MSDDDKPHCETCTCYDDVFLPKSDLDDYPITRSEYTPLDAVDIKKTSQSWIALLYCESVKGYGKTFRFHMWRKPKAGGAWYVSRCNFPADNNFALPANLQRMTKFIKKYRSE